MKGWGGRSEGGSDLSITHVRLLRSDAVASIADLPQIDLKVQGNSHILIPPSLT